MSEEQQKKSTFQRRIIFIKKGMQFRYIAAVMLSAIFAFIITIHEVIWAFDQIVVKNPEISVFASEVYALMPVFIFKACLFLGILLIFAVVVSHQQAGPIYKFEKSMNCIKNGDLTCRVYLRKGDRMTEFQKEFNDMAASLHGIVAEYENFRAYAAGSDDEKVRERAVETEERVKKILPELKL